MKDLKDKLLSGEDVNHTRMLQLNLFDRKRRGENLSETESKVLAEFLKVEEMQDNPLGLDVPPGSPVQPNFDDEVRGTVSSAMESSEQIASSETLKSKDDDESKLQSSDTNRLQANIKKFENLRSNQEGIVISSEPDNLGDDSEKMIDEAVHSETSKTKEGSASQFKSSDGTALNTGVRDSRDSSYIESDEESERFPDESSFRQKSKEKDNAESKRASIDAVVLNAAVQNLKDSHRIEAELDMSATEMPPRAPIILRDDEDVNDSVKETDVNDTAREAQPEKEQNLEDEDEDSSLSSWELNELDDLIKREEQGFDVPQDRLRNLEYFDRWQNGEVLNEDELKALARFKKNRRKERRYGRELINMIESRERGEEIDHDRLIALELYARYHTGEELTTEELENLNEFELRESEEENNDRHVENDVNDEESNDYKLSKESKPDDSKMESSFDDHFGDNANLFSPTITNEPSSPENSFSNAPLNS